tara:strand:- start:256 stop:372 length:117 start_codon:yes stop_codon:yes gene_type:complete
MEILGTIGFIFGVAALAQVTQLKRELAILKKDIDILKK